MKPTDVQPGQTYLANAGGWLFEVTHLLWADEWFVQYTVVQTGQRCQATPADFLARVARLADLDSDPNRGARPR